MNINQKINLFFLFFLAWFALIAQFCIQVKHGNASTSELIIRFFSYFTILSNLLLAICVTSLLINSKNIFTRQTTQTAIAVYIFIVGLIYNIILRFNWHPQGMQKIVDELLHVINPVLFIIYWMLFSNYNKLKWKTLWLWLIYPLLYIIFVLLRGKASGFYPYPFLEINKLGFDKVLINCTGITILFLLTSAVFLAAGNYIVKRKIKF